ncbi:GlsB/YeaQ/YmgE family stress response membrane protein [Actinoplanes sp. HUAS TT8]|uniref:GlsB/YeaQ/YmgE family stress response membrane protein n=1 Tax=Actinoplanes sp. HUAS TT8 TaxID=3447453 RepID=UPI003F51C7C5
MTASSLLTAVTIGLVIGLAGRLLPRRARSVPVWLPAAAGVGAAVLATVIVRMTVPTGAGPGAAEVALQVLFATAGVAGVVTTADRPKHAHDGGAR